MELEFDQATEAELIVLSQEDERLRDSAVVKGMLERVNLFENKLTWNDGTRLVKLFRAAGYKGFQSTIRGCSLIKG